MTPSLLHLERMFTATGTWDETKSRWIPVIERPGDDYPLILKSAGYTSWAAARNDAQRVINTLCERTEGLFKQLASPIGPKSPE